MSKNKTLINRIIAVVLIIFGLILGITWNHQRFCIGDIIFSAIGLQAWSNGTSGTHYPAVAGTFAILIGIGLFNSTLQKKNRFWSLLTLAFVLIVTLLLLARL